MEVGNIYRVTELHQGLPSGCYRLKKPTGRASLVAWSRRLLKALWIPAVILAGVGLGSSAAFGGTDQSGKISFDGASSGVLINSRGATNLVNSGVGTNSYSWGLGVGSPSSSLSFLGTTVNSAMPEQPFALGTLSHFNGQVLLGTEAYSIGLRTTLSFSGLTQNFDYGFQLITTPNTSNPLQSADSVLFSSSIPTTRFTVDGINYTVKLAFGSVTGSGFSEVNQFFVLEGGSASADLIGSITANIPADTTSPAITTSPVGTSLTVTPGGPTPTVVPEPSTVLGGISAGGLILAFLVRRLRKGGSPTVLA